MTTISYSENRSTKRHGINPIVIIGILFFIFGFVTWLNSTLIVFLKISCQLTYIPALLVATAFYVSYFVMAMPSSLVLHKTGFKNGMALGLFIMALGSLLFIPAALTRTYWVFLVGLFIQGSGLTLLQTAANPYVAILGPQESAAKRISIMGICNKVAGVISPIVLGFIVLKNADEITQTLKTITGAARESLLDSLAQRVIIPYIIMAIVLVGLSLLLRMVHLPDIDTDNDDVSVNEPASRKRYLVQFPHLILGFVALFLYVGAEVISIDTIIPYGQSLGFSLDTARLFSSYALVAMVIGYILGIIAIPRFISQSKALAISALLGIIFTIASIVSSGFVSIAFLALLGLANALMWPTIWPLSIADLGKFIKSGSALLIMGILGGATLPLVYGFLSEQFNSNQQAYWILVPIYLFIFYFSTKGHKIRR